MTRGTTQEGLILSTLFDLIVDKVVRNRLVLNMEDKLVTNEGLVLVVGRCLGLFTPTTAWWDCGIQSGSRDPSTCSLASSGGMDW